MSNEQLDQLTEDEIKAIIKQRYRKATEDGTFGKLEMIARELGVDPASIDKDGNPTGYVSTYGPKRVWSLGNIRIYIDDYGHYMTVHVGEKQVVSTHETKRFIIAGDWLDLVLIYHPGAFARHQEREDRWLAERRKQLLEMAE